MKRPTYSRPLSSATNIFWQTARASALAVTLVVLAGLAIRPEQTLTIAWFGIVPILPASFLINAGLWRSVCPIATANTISGKPVGKQALAGRGLRIATAIGIVLLIILVPMRRLVLNQNGLVLAAVLIAIVAAALLLGFRFNMKAGFCNGLCPILPVEKLYGQSPLVYVRNPRCIPCSLCTKKGCYDLDPPGAMIDPVRGSGKTRDWLLSVPGLFMVAFPGFVYGYFQTTDSSFSEWLPIYGAILIPAAISAVILGGLVLLLNGRDKITLPVLGALPVGIYYWYAGPASADAFGWSASVGLSLRWVFLALVAGWFFRAIRRSNERPGGGSAQERHVEPARLPNIY